MRKTGKVVRLSLTDTMYEDLVIVTNHLGLHSIGDTLRNGFLMYKNKTFPLYKSSTPVGLKFAGMTAEEKSKVREGEELELRKEFGRRILAGKLDVSGENCEVPYYSLTPTDEVFIRPGRETRSIPVAMFPSADRVENVDAANKYFSFCVARGAGGAGSKNFVQKFLAMHGDGKFEKAGVKIDDSLVEFLTEHVKSL